ncbi:MAG TPA: hypothetical protein VKY70_00975 [Pseudomonas sp.]|nr:hypothetical protein [Pseudomonas sp.]
MNAPEILTKAAGHLADRAVTYDKPEGERSMALTVAVFNQFHGTSLTEAQGWHFMQILKDVRLFSRPGYHADSGEDGVAYAALKAEAKAKECLAMAIAERATTIAKVSDAVTACLDVAEGWNMKTAEQIDPAVVQHVELFNAMTMKGKREPVGPDVEFDQSGRMDPIGQNGNTGEHYDLPSTDALVDPTGKPTWDMAPIWANYLTQDASGVWKWWNKMPVPGNKAWSGIGMSAEVNSGEVRGNWFETLEHAPGQTKTEKRA